MWDNKKKPVFIILDEVDKAVQADMMVTIMNKIFDYTKKNKIITFVIAHSTEIKNNSKYTQKISLNKGIITIN